MALTESQIIELAVHVLHTMQTPAKPIDIAQFAVQPQFRGHCMQHGFEVDEFLEDPYGLAIRVGTYLNRHVNATPPAKRAVTKSRDRWSLGPGAMQVMRVSNQAFKKPGDSQFTGLVGEYAVMSELLAIDWNVAKLPHDDGVDIIATKGGELRSVQVKTAHGSGPGHRKFLFSVQQRAHLEHNSIRHYYVLVMRRIVGPRYVNDFVILNTFDLSDLINAGAVEIGSARTWKISVDAEGAEVSIKGHDIKSKLNQFWTLFL